MGDCEVQPEGSEAGAGGVNATLGNLSPIKRKSDPDEAKKDGRSGGAEAVESFGGDAKDL